MPEFDFFLEKKVSIWQKEHYIVKAETREEATKLITYKFDERGQMDIEGVIECQSCETMYDTEEPISVESNNGKPTLELWNDDGFIISDNGFDI